MLLSPIDRSIVSLCLVEYLSHFLRLMKHHPSTIVTLPEHDASSLFLLWESVQSFSVEVGSQEFSSQLYSDIERVRSVLAFASANVPGS